MLLLIVLSGCAGISVANDSAAMPGAMSGSSVSASSAQTLQRYHWQLSDAVDKHSKRIDTLFGKSGKPLQLDFRGTRLSISNACNAIHGNYRIVDGHLHTEVLLQTMMACMDRTLRQRESIIKATLQNKPELILSGDNGEPHMSLVITNGQRLTFTGKATAQTRYAGPGETIFLEVSARTVACGTDAASDESCLRVRERHYDANGLRTGTPGPWHRLQQPIEDFTPEPGVRYVIRLKRYSPKAADTTAAYVIDTIIESEGTQPSS